MNLYCIDGGVHCLKLRISYPFIGIKLKAESKKIICLLSFPTEKGIHDFKCLKVKIGLL